MRRIGLIGAVVVAFSACGDLASSPENGVGVDDQLAYAIGAAGEITVAEHDCSPLVFNGASVVSSREKPDGYGSIWQLSTGDDPVEVDVLRLGEVPEGVEEDRPWTPPAVGDDLIVLVGSRDGNRRIVSIHVEAGPVGTMACEGD